MKIKYYKQKTGNKCSLVQMWRTSNFCVFWEYFFFFGNYMTTQKIFYSNRKISYCLCFVFFTNVCSIVGATPDNSNSNHKLVHAYYSQNTNNLITVLISHKIATSLNWYSNTWLTLNRFYRKQHIDLPACVCVCIFLFGQSLCVSVATKAKVLVRCMECVIFVGAEGELCAPVF